MANKNVNQKFAETGSCCICGRQYERGNNARPLARGVCCSSCNTKYVIPIREYLSSYLSSIKAKENEKS